MPLDPVATNDPHVPAHNAERAAINALALEVDTKISLPSGAATGDLLRWDGTEWLTTETRFFEGNGRPDGNIAGPVGSRYIDKLGAQGAVEWVKRAGGDTAFGWICLAGDTGKRNIAAQILLRTGTLVNSAFLIRSGQVVQMYVDLKMPSVIAPDPYKIYDLPAGFRPVADIYGGLLDNKEGADTGGTLVAANGEVNIYNIVAGKTDRYHGTWATRDAWPEILPGSDT